MLFFVLEPEVAGGLGASTMLDRSSHPPTVHHLHYEFDGWLGDELLESFPCFIVTESLAATLTGESATGVQFGEVQVSVSTQFTDFHGTIVDDLPSFRRLIPTGIPGQDDFGVMPDGSLVVSAHALELLKHHQLDHCDITPYLIAGTS